jgi:hypothetical protein
LHQCEPLFEVNFVFKSCNNKTAPLFVSMYFFFYIYFLKFDAVTNLEKEKHL